LVKLHKREKIRKEKGTDHQISSYDHKNNEEGKIIIKIHIYLSKRNVFVLGLEGEFLGELFPCGLDNLVAFVSR
jgi:hypothetical protein